MKKRIIHIFSIFLITILSVFLANPTSAQIAKTQNRVFIQIEVLGMACPYCAFGMEKELKKVAGVEKVEIELKEGLAFISTPLLQKPTAESLEKIITNAGFTAGKIEFSNTPFGDLE